MTASAAEIETWNIDFLSVSPRAVDDNAAVSEFTSSPIDVLDNDIEVFWSPGAFEIPVLAKRITSMKKFDAVICLGAVIRGSTPHFDIVANESAKGLSAIALDHGLPVINGILTTENIEQTIERAGTKAGNKGSEAAAAAIEMVNIFKQLG